MEVHLRDSPVNEIYLTGVEPSGASVLAILHRRAKIPGGEVPLLFGNLLDWVFLFFYIVFVIILRRVYFGYKYYYG